jgi:hypothetical protein
MTTEEFETLLGVRKVLFNELPEKHVAMLAHLLNAHISDKTITEGSHYFEHRYDCWSEMDDLYKEIYKGVYK